MHTPGGSWGLDGPLPLLQVGCVQLLLCSSFLRVPLCPNPRLCHLPTVRVLLQLALHCHVLHAVPPRPVALVQRPTVKEDEAPEAGQ